MRARSRVLVIGLGTTTAIVLLALACGDSLEVNPNDPTNNAAEGGVGADPDAAFTIPSSDSGEAPLDPDPDDEPLEPIPDAGCSDASFFEPFSPIGAARTLVTEDGGTADVTADGFLVTSANNVMGAAGYVRRGLCGASPAVTCTMRVKVLELIKGQLSLLELRGIDNGNAITIRVKTNQTQITGRDAPIANQLLPGMQQDFVEIKITARRGEIQIDPGRIKYDAGLADMKFTEIRGGIIYLTRSDFDAARALVRVDSIACQFGP